MTLKYFFTTKDVSDEFASKVRVLDQFDEAAFKSIVTIIFTFMLDPSQGEELVDNIEEFAEEHGMKVEGVQSSIQAVLTMLRGALKMNLTPEKLKKDLTTFGLNEAKSTLVARGWKVNMALLSRNAAAQTFNANRVLDLEWRFGIAAGSSEMRKAGHTFLQLKLVIDKGSHSEDVFMEMTVSQFYEFLKEMQIAKRTVDALSN